MNERRLERLKRLAAGAALVTATLTQAGDPPKPTTKPNSPGAEPVRMNSPGPQKPQPEPAVVDAGVQNVEEAPNTRPPTMNSPPPKPPKPPNVNSPPRPTK